MDKFYNLGGNGCVLDDPSVLCLALLNHRTPNKHLAHVKIDPLGTYSNKLSHFQSDFSDENIFSGQRVMSANEIFEPGLSSRNCCATGRSLPVRLDSHTIIAQASHLPTQQTSGIAEVSQHSYGRFEHSLVILLGLYIISSYPKLECELDRLFIPRHRSKYSRGELTLNGEEASSFFINIFRKKLFYGIVRAPSVPHYILSGLDYAFNCWKNFKFCSIDTYVAELISRASPCICATERNKWFQYQYQQWESIYTLWRGTMSNTLQQGKHMQDLSDSHIQFTMKLSALNSSLSELSNIIGIDLASLGPIFKDHHDGVYKQVYLCPPYVMPAEDNYDFGALMFAKVYRHLLSAYEIDFSKIRILGPTLKEILPEGYHRSFCEQQCNVADRLESYLSEPLNTNSSSAEDSTYSSLYRVTLPVEYWKIVRYYSAARRGSHIE